MAAASAWQALSIEYAAIAAELSAVLAAVQDGAWQGPTAARYASAHVPYLDWLYQTSIMSAGTALQHEAAAAAYAAALAAMPTLAELAANHAVHGVLAATNFFGINTIPIALNEADYVRMWIQAATTMTVYQAISHSAVAALTPTEPSPPIMAAEAATSPPTDPIEELLAWSEHFTSMYRALKELITNPLGTVVQLITDFATNPAAALTTWLPLIYVGAYAATFALLGTPIYTVIAAPGFGAIPLAIGLSALCAPPGSPAELAAEVPGVVAAEQHAMPVTGISPTVTTAGAAPAPHLPSQGSVTTATAATPPGVTPSQGFAYLVAGPGPGPTVGPALHHKATASAPASNIAAASAASASIGSKARARGRRHATVKNRGHRDEYLSLDDTPDWPQDEPSDAFSGSTTGAGQLGFTGTATKLRVRDAAGLTTLAGGSFTEAPTVPMMPATWSTDTGEPKTR